MTPSFLSVEQAQVEVLGGTEALRSEAVAIARCSGRVLAHDVLATWDLPQADVSVMDGFAVQASALHSGCELPVVGESAAGHPFAATVPPGAAVRISTGALVPAGTDAVVPREDATFADGMLHVDLARYGHVAPGRWVRSRGCDQAQGTPILTAGIRLGATDLAAAAAVGCTELRVHRRPRVTLLSTGDELIRLGETPRPGQVVSTNALMLATLLTEAGAEVDDRGIISDDPEHLRAALEDASESDLWVTSGGISVGEHDHTASVLAALGCTFAFHGVAMKPGKPLAFARRGSIFAFALPGNPASSFVAFWLFLRPLLRRLAGARGAVSPPLLRPTLRAAAEGAGARAHYVRGRLHPDGTATPLQEQRSGSLSSMVDVDALLIVPPRVPELPAGATIDALVLDPWWNERRNASSP